jgi:hypothetical protein
MKNILKGLAIEAGAKEAIYENQDLANVLTDYSEDVTIAIIDEIKSADMRIGANGVNSEITLTVSFLKTTMLEETAEINDRIMAATYRNCERFLLLLSKSEHFRIRTATASKHNEGLTDANLIGWTLTIPTTLINGFVEC